MSRADTAELLDLLIDRAEKLRKAGIVSAQLGDFRVELRPFEPDIPADFGKRKDDEELPSDPLHDADTYGGRVPGRARREHA